MSKHLLLLWMLASPLLAAPYHKPSAQQAARVSLGQGLTGADLERVKVGNQAGILKVMAKDGHTVAFLKGGETGMGVASTDGSGPPSSQRTATRSCALWT